MRTWLKRIALGLAVILVIVALAGGFVVRRSFPQTRGTVSLVGLDGAATVTRDDAGVPQIVAGTAHDLFFAQGYVHAQDRFWQMDFWRHIGAGRLSEMFGEDQVGADTFLRTMGWRLVAEREYELMSDDPHTLEALDAYAEGVNAYLADRSPSQVSLEYAILGLQNPDYVIEPWTPVDTITWTKVMAWDLRSNLDEELDRALLAAEFGFSRAEQMYPHYRADFPVIVDAGPVSAAATEEALWPAEPLLEVKAAIAEIDAIVGQRYSGIGSNSWVVSGDRTASGKPLLANDPHLGIQMPSIWYENHLRCETKSSACPYDVVGFSFPGAPGVVIGHNDRIAWGFTNEAPDSMDVFIESVEPDGRYLTPDGPREFEVRTETIEVAGGEPVKIEIRSTVHGPVISGVYVEDDDIRPSAMVEVPQRFTVALWWTALQPGTTVQALIGLNRATNWEEFREAAGKFEIAAQNMLYADVDGNIGYQATGKVPVRSGWSGRYPVPGWDFFGCESFVPPADLPSVFNPDSGFIETANQPVTRVRTASAPGYVGADHSSGYRANRITELLDGLSSATPEDMTAIQLDVADGSAGFLVPLITDLGLPGPVAGLLSGWEAPYLMAADSPEAAAYAGAWRHLVLNTFDELEGDRLPADHSRLFAVFYELVDEPDGGWWDITATPDTETRDDILAASVAAADAELIGLLGEDPSKWRWGDLHIATFENQTLGQSGISPIEALFNRTSPPDLGGGAEIVNAIGWTAGNGYQVDWLPSFRMVVDLADLTNSTAVHTTGQSGHAFNRHYFDMNPHWVEGTTRPMPWADVAGNRLVLEPA